MTTRIMTLACLATLTVGCATAKTTNTARTAKEQLLISNSVDQSLDKVDFTAFNGNAVFFDEKYLDCVDKTYVVGSIRHRILRGGGRLVAKAEEADVIVEARSGGVGTNTSETFFGTPELAVPGPLPISIPEVKLMSKQEQTGMAKIGLVAYDAKTRSLLGDGGTSLAQSNDSNWYVLGVGPYQTGTVRQEVSEGLDARPAHQPVPNFVAFESPNNLPNAPSPDDVQWANGESTGQSSVIPASR